MKSQRLTTVGTAFNCSVRPLESAADLMEGSLKLDSGEVISIETRANRGALSVAFRSLIDKPGKVEAIGTYYHARMGFPARLQLISLRRLDGEGCGPS